MNKKSVVITLAVLFVLAAFAGGQSAVQAEDGHNEGKTIKKVENTLKQAEKFATKALNIFEGDGEIRLKGEDGDIADIKDIRSSVAINAGGNSAIQNGTIESIGTNTFTVKVWGLSFKVNTSNSTDIVDGRRGRVVINFSDFQVGDRVDVRGTTSESKPGEIEAKIIRNRSAFTRLAGTQVSTIQRQIEELLKKIEELRKLAGVSPSPTRTATPSASPTQTATPSPTVTPSPTATPSPTQTATPSPTPSNT